MNDIERLVQRAVNGITSLARRAARFATRLLVFTVVLCVGGFALGIAALSDGIETVWIVLGAVFGAIAIGSAFVARWRVGAVTRHVPELADEVRSLVTRDAQAGQTVIEVFSPDDARYAGTEPDPEAGSAIVMSRQMYGFRNVAGRTFEHSTRMAGAVQALTSFPLLALAAVAISLVFGFFSAIFLLALAL